MSNSRILSTTQQKFLELFGKTSLANTFYLTGGTALAGFYIPYRLSEDLDFFSENEVNTQEILVFIRSVKKTISYTNLDISTSFNRNLIFLKFKKQPTLKTEFTYFPFPQIEKPEKMDGIAIDSPIDIAVNKLFTIYQKPRSRDFIDLYMVVKKYNFSLEDIIKKARIKFDWSIDYIQLGAQFLESKELKDFPHILKPIDESKWRDFFIEEAKKLKSKILS